MGSWIAALALAVSACTPLAPALPMSAAPAPPPYEREAFGARWASTGRGCDTRDVILARDLEPDQRRGCNVVGGTLRDPYTGVVVVGPSRALDVDHVVPLGLAWRLGAWRWSRERRIQYANDPSNLRVTLAKVNRAKSDQGLDEWLPLVDRCGYAHGFDAVADRYGLVDARRDGQVAAACR
jgi:hypothetical protein